MARHAVKFSKYSDAPHSRGFVLSFSTFALALFLFIFAQIQYTHTLDLQLDASNVHQTLSPARVLRDLALDFNALTGQTISLDQNRDTTIFRIAGKMPNPLSLQTNLLRYQTGLFRFGRDTNTSIFLDLNQSVSDSNMWGRTSNRLRWRESFDSNHFRIFPNSSTYYPSRFDVNIYSDVAYESISIIPITGTLGGGFHVASYTVNYTDTNNDHNYSQSSTFTGNQALNLVYTYNAGGSNVVKILSLGGVDAGVSASNFGTAINGAPTIPWTYAITYALPNDLNGTRAGYDINTTIRGADFNVDTNTIWTYGG